jgi:anti-sigma B factor antagonist
MRLHAPAPDVGVVRVSGVVDMTSAALLAERAGHQLDRAPYLVIDPGDVTFLGTRGLQVVRALAGEAAVRGGHVHLTAEHHAVLHPLHVTGLDRLLSVSPTAEAAVAALRR